MCKNEVSQAVLCYVGGVTTHSEGNYTLVAKCYFYCLKIMPYAILSLGIASDVSQYCALHPENKYLPAYQLVIFLYCQNVIFQREAGLHLLTYHTFHDIVGQFK